MTSDDTERTGGDPTLDALDAAIEEAHRKVESGRVYDTEAEQIRIEWVRVLTNAVDVRRRVVEVDDAE